MRIAHYFKPIRLEQGGVVRSVLDLCAVTATAGHDVTLLTPDARDVPVEWRDGSPGLPRVVELPRPSLPGQLFTSAAMRSIEESLRRVEVLHLHAIWIPANIQLAAAARRLALPYVSSVHGMLDEWSMSIRPAKKRVYMAAFGRRMLRGAAAVHCTSHAELEQARAWFPGDKGIVIPLLLDLSPFRDLPGPDLARQALPLPADDRPTILFLSRLHPGKGVELLIEAVGGLREQHVDCNLLIAGSGDPSYVAKLKRTTSRLGLDDRVRFLGFVSGREKVSLFQAADVFCLPSEHENFGMVWAESLASGTPVVTTTGIGNWSDLQAGGGALITERSAGAFRDAIKGLLGDPHRLRAMGEAGRRWILSFLDTERIVARFEALYAGAAGGAA